MSFWGGSVKVTDSSMKVGSKSAIWTQREVTLQTKIFSGVEGRWQVMREFIQQPNLASTDIRARPMRFAGVVKFGWSTKWVKSAKSLNQRRSKHQETCMWKMAERLQVTADAHRR